MANIKIVTDSSAALLPEEIEKFDLKVVPLSVVIDDEAFEDGVDLTREQFIEKMIAAKDLPKTSQPPIGRFTEVYDALYQQDPDVEIISIHMSSGLSGTVQAARQAGDISKAQVTVIDSHGTDRGLSFQVLKAAELAAEGKTIAEILPVLETIQEQTKIFLSIVDLKNLIAGGRISRLQGAVAELMNIKVGLSFDHDEINTIVRGRGMKTIKKFYQDIIAEMKQLSKVESIGISHAGASKEAAELAEELKTLFPDVFIAVTTTASIIATHTAAGALALEFYGK